MFAVLEVPIIIFLVIVAPVWIVFHYVFRDKQKNAEPAQDRQKIEELLAKADRMETRLKTLESILDREHPTWRTEV